MLYDPRFQINIKINALVTGIIWKWYACLGDTDVLSLEVWGEHSEPPAMRDYLYVSIQLSDCMVV